LRSCLVFSRLKLNC